MRMSSMTIMKVLLALWLGLVSLCAEVNPGQLYLIEDVAMPANVPAEVGALAIKDGQLYLALRRGDIIVAKMVSDAKAFKWTLFATGFHNPCGMEFDQQGRLLITQMSELTRCSDTDGDGRADLYEALCHWGLSGNYHETVEMCPDGKGGFYLAIGTASHNGPTFKWVKGEYSKIGRRGRNFSSVEWRGWVMHYQNDGQLKPFASGFRMHNGIAKDSKGNIWATDNQGDWKGTTPLYLVAEGNFYGHPSSLVWDPKWPKDKDPLKVGLDEINSLRTRPVVQFPYSEQIRSASEPIEFPAADKFGPYSGQLIVPDNNGSRLARVMLENVGGQLQGATTLFLEGGLLHTGNNRVIYAPDKKSLFVGQTIRGWGKLSEGLQRITYVGGTPLDILNMRLTKNGFKLEFTSAPNKEASDLSSYVVHSFRYEDSWVYGSPKYDEIEHKVTSVRRIDEKTYEVEIEGLQAGKLFDLTIKRDLSENEKHSLKGRSYCYTVNQLK